MLISVHLVVIAVFGLVVLAAMVGSVFGPVARGRLERFARRQKLTVTAANGNQIIAYLATTRRWRGAGVAVGLIAPVVWSGGRSVSFDVVYIFVGWFAGAIIAEARVAHRAVGPRRAASLEPRQATSYLSRFSWWLLPAATALSIGVALFSVVTAVAGRWARPDWTAVIWPAVAVAVAVLVRATQLRVLRRPQPHAETDVIAGDDAIRSRSLHVLAGGGAAVVLYCVWAQLGALNPELYGPLWNMEALLRALGLIAIPGLAWNVGTWAWRVRRGSTGSASTA